MPTRHGRRDSKPRQLQRGFKVYKEVCSACHGLDGNSENAIYPVIAGQHESYLRQSLRDYKSGARQNAIMQAREFQQSVAVSGLVVTKLDGTAKGGIVISICSSLKIPLQYIGVGEQLDDLRPFDAEQFIEALF